MKTQIDVITGFLEAGKTTFLYSLLKQEMLEEEKIVILLCEEGIKQLSEEALAKKNIFIEIVEQEEDLNSQLFETIQKKYHPTRILIEYNGTWPMKVLLSISLPSQYFIGSIFCMVDASTFQVYMSNMSGLLSEQIADCDAILLSKEEELEDQETLVVTQSLRNINKKAKILYTSDYEIWEDVEDLLEVGSRIKVDMYLKYLIVFLSLGAVYIYIRLFKLPGFSDQLAILQQVNTIFLSVIIQAVPFILLGVLIASVLQVVISDQQLIRLFTYKKWLGFPMAIVLGVFFPVCDCAMVPITARLIKKGIPLSQAITFMLAAPAVNPIVITSTLYAFPGQPKIVIYRIVTGILIAVCTGIFLECILGRKHEAVNERIIKGSCGSGYLGEMNYTGRLGVLEAVMRHAGMEFINVAKFVVIGAFISAVMQVSFPTLLGSSGGEKAIFSLVIMSGAAFFMSVCSSSNAFIGRSFSSIFPLSSILGFMVMGPMLDIKNVLMMFGNFSKRFVLLYIGSVLSLSFVIFSLMSKWL